MFAIRSGRYLLGVRAREPHTATVLRRLCAGRILEEADPPPNLSVSLPGPDPSARGPRPIARLDWGSSAQATHRDPAVVLRAFAAWVLAFDRDLHTDLVDLDATAVVAGGRAALVPTLRLATRNVVERALARRRTHLVHRPWALVDPTTAELVVDDPRALGGEHLTGPVGALGTPAVAPGRYPLAGWALPAVDEEHSRPALALLHAMGAVRARTECAPGLLHRMSHLTQHTQMVRTATTHEAVTATVGTLLG